MLRRTILAAPLMALAACSRRGDKIDTARKDDRFDVERLRKDIPAIAERAAPGVLGVAITEPRAGGVYAFNGERRFPMQSVFKAPLAAAVLAEVEAGRVTLSETITIRDVDLSPAYSPIAAAWPGVSAYTIEDLLVRCAGDSDNTAADLLLKRIGGPGALTAWLVSKGVKDIRVDRYERELQPESMGLASFRPAWKDPDAYRAALATVPDERKREAVQAYLLDPRDTATPSGMVDFLEALVGGSLLNIASTQRLLKIMAETKRGVDRLPAALPAGARIAHKPGTSGTVLGVAMATNDVGVYTLSDGRHLSVAVFLSGATLDLPAREALIAEVGRAAIAAVG